MKTMKALRMTRSGSSAPQLAVQDVEIPQTKDGELLVKIHASFVQPADVLNSTGGFGMTTYPRTLGKDFSGTVVYGSQYWRGKDVFGTSGNSFSFTADGAQAEYAILNEGCVVEKPRNISHAQAASLGTPMSTANITLQRASIKREDTVMVLGATGSVGSLVMQIAKAHGCKTISVGRHGTDVNSVEDPQLQRAKDLSGGRGPDIVVDTVGDFALVKAAFDVMNTRGRMSFISAPRSGSTELPVDILSLYRRQISLVGCNSAGESQEVLTDILEDLVPYIEAGTLKAPEEKDLNLIGLDQALDAYAGKIKKAVIVFD